MANLEHPEPIRVRVRWGDGHVQTIPDEVDGTKSETFLADANGELHRFRDSGEVDHDGFHIFEQHD